MDADFCRFNGQCGGECDGCVEDVEVVDKCVDGSTDGGKTGAY